MQRVLVQVPLSQAFVCPECAAPLRPPVSRRLSGRRDWLPVLRLGVLAAAMAVSLGAGYAIGRVQDEAGAAARSAALDAGAGLASAARSFGITDPPPEAAVPPAASSPIRVAAHPYPAHGPGQDVGFPAERLAHEARFGQVTVDCVVEVTAGRPACTVSDIKGADAFSAQALAWLQGLDVRYEPVTGAGTTGTPEHRWRVVLDDFSGTARHVIAPR